MDAKTNIKARLPSRHVTEGPDRAPHRSYLYAMGLTREQIHQPFVGVATCWNEAAPCNISLMRQAPAAGAPAPYEMRDAFCMTAGEQVMERIECPIRPRDIVTRKALHVADVFKRTPYIADLKPSSRYVAKDLFEVGGVPLLMKTLLDHGFLHGDCTTVTGRTVSENLKRVTWNADQDVVRPADKPLSAVKAVRRPGERHVRHPGNVHDGASRRDGDMITLDAEKGTLDVALSASEFDMRARAWKAREPGFGSGYLWKYAQQVGPARDGAVTHPGGAGEKACYADI
jgi:dihydroxyacid dehydratase/phosphogluconate dehydratase